MVLSLTRLERNLYSDKTVNILEIELTTYCNAYCGACDRNIAGGAVNPHMPLQHMTMDTWRNIVTLENLKHISTINFDGNFGDASMHPELINFLEYLSTIKTNLLIKMSTNGGARNQEFWKQLAHVLRRFDYHEVQFAIDGLADTNHIYRRGVVWERLMENTSAFIDAGGFAICRMIVFHHNKKQIERAADVAYNLGFSKFKTYRNRTDPIKMVNYKNFPNSTVTGPSRQEYENKYKVYHNFTTIVIPKEHELTEYDYACPFGIERTVVVDYDGSVWPCCFIQGNRVTKHTEFEYDNYIYTNNLNDMHLTDILAFMRELLYNAWQEDSYKICNKCLHKENRPTQHNVKLLQV